MMKKRLPNLLTYSRILVIPVIIAAFYWDGKPAYLVPAILFLYASVTDFFDGYLARAWHASSALGRFLDPIADKLLIATCLMMLVAEERAPLLPAVAILCREILVSGLREHLAELRVTVPVSTLAKYKTAIQMIAIFLLLLGEGGPHWLGSMAGHTVRLDAAILGCYGLWAAAALTLVTGYAYLKQGLKHFA